MDTFRINSQEDAIILLRHVTDISINEYLDVAGKTEEDLLFVTFSKDSRLRFAPAILFNTEHREHDIVAHHSFVEKKTLDDLGVSLDELVEEAKNTFVDVLKQYQGKDVFFDNQPFQECTNLRILRLAPKYFDIEFSVNLIQHPEILSEYCEKFSIKKPVVAPISADCVVLSEHDIFNMDLILMELLPSFRQDSGRPEIFASDNIFSYDLDTGEMEICI